MRVIESYVESKTGDFAECEDGLIVTNSFIGVVDGATSKSGKTWNGRTSGQIARDIIIDSIKKLHSSASLENTLELFTKNLRDFYKDNNNYTEVRENPILRASASVAIYSKHFHEIWLIGDCHCLVNGKSYDNKKLIDSITSNARALFLEAELQAGRKVNDLLHNDNGREYIKPLLKKQYIFQNSNKSSPFSYGVLDGFPVNKKSVKVITLDDINNEIILASDGYPTLYNNLKQSEEYLSYLLKVDPLCININKSSKGLVHGNISFDDRAFIKFYI